MMKTIAEKLLIKPHTTVWLSDPAQLPLLTPMPDGVREVETLATASTAVLFADSAASAREQLEQHSADLAKPGVFWVAYPRATRPTSTGTRCGRSSPTSTCARAARWRSTSAGPGLRFRANREGEGRFTGGAK